MNGNENKGGVPLGVLLMTLVATLFFGAGALGLLAPDIVPALARAAVAWSLIAVGIILDVGAILLLVSSRRTSSSG